MAMTQQQRDDRRREKAARLQEEDLRLKVRPGTKQALLELMEWAGIEEQGEAMTLMIHHLAALGPPALLQILRHEMTRDEVVAQREVIRLAARPGTMRELTALKEWSLLNAETLIQRLIHGIHSLGRHQEVKFLAPPRHEIKLSSHLTLAFHQKSMLMIQQDPGDEVVIP